MNRPNTDYRLRQPARDEIVRAFGSMREAYRITGGDLPTLCYYLANPERAKDAPDAPPGSDQRAREMRLEVEVEAAAASWDAQPADQRRTIAAVMRDTGRSRNYTRHLLEIAGKVAPGGVDIPVDYG